ncbi:MAG: hypothetical protein BGP06_12620 [Rhizobiales bacterium 65-9]|nr:MAG: hypothetical protein BGP06_12620 [Rhizobiales bacterium 65-9]
MLALHADDGALSFCTGDRGPFAEIFRGLGRTRILRQPRWRLFAARAFCFGEDKLLSSKNCGAGVFVIVVRPAERSGAEQKPFRARKHRHRSASG